MTSVSLDYGSGCILAEMYVEHKSRASASGANIGNLLNVNIDHTTSDVAAAAIGPAATTITGVGRALDCPASGHLDSDSNPDSPIPILILILRRKAGRRLRLSTIDVLVLVLVVVDCARRANNPRKCSSPPCNLRTTL